MTAEDWDRLADALARLTDAVDRLTVAVNENTADLEANGAALDDLTEYRTPAEHRPSRPPRLLNPRRYPR